MLTSEEMKAAMRRYVDLLNAGDLEGVLALFADDATVEDPVGSNVQRGKDEIRAFYTQAIASSARLRITAPQRGSAGNAAAMALDVEVTMSGGPTMLIGVIETMHFNDAGKVVTMQAFWGPEDMAMAAAT